MTEERYFQIISEKTASLISACCECGASAATDDPEVADAMREIGMNIGIAFQIKDDLFDYGLDDVGKPKRNDIQERKVTLPLIKAFDNASFTEILTIRRLMKKRKKSDKDVSRIVDFVHEKGGLEKAEKSMNTFAEKAMAQLEELPVERGLEDFKNLVTFITNRKK
jgi:octaprenyl-diphosphate synthase